MSKQLDRILLILLWLLAVALGASFWFRTTFGFDIFAANHWQYLSYLQATHQHIRPGFYISMAISAAITLAGLYVLLRPQLGAWHMPKITKLFKRRAHTSASAPPAQPHTSQPEPPASTPATNPESVPTPQNAPARPPRLNITRAPTPPAGPAQTSAHMGATAAPSQTEGEIDAIKKIFEDAGYITKPRPMINNFKPALIAIGTDEQLWIGAIATTPDTIERITTKFSDIFSDTLDDIEININAFIIGATGGGAPENILTFEDTNALREYMRDYPNPPPPENDDGNFDAYSEYIDTVLNYIGKI